ncbi:DegT/DnrJ/EryC1/StrS family aminotransferase [Candidatus Woesearchaeota archaeon]|nr:DegT/DnrJ/EryC1/StrS family aminotransferase [Candidatus Woesearchaeota archaeon]
MKIPFVDLKASYISQKEAIDAALAQVIEQTDFVNGKDVSLFEQEFADYCESKYCVSTNSGTSALFLALKVLDIKEGDEVITTPHTFIATGEVIIHSGASIKLVDIDQKTYNIDSSKLEAAITKKTKAIIAVHLYGYPCAVDKIIEIARKHNLFVIEDCAQAHGCMYHDKKVPQGDIGCFSFYPAKNLGCFGDGGAIVFNNSNIKNMLIALRNHGRLPGQKYEHNYLGYNERMDSLQAAVLRVKLKALEFVNEKRRTLAQRYTAAFKDISSQGKIILPYEEAHAKPVYYVYTVRVKQRSAVMSELEKRGIPTQIYFPIPLHLQPAFSCLGLKKGSYPISEKIADEILSLPIYPELSSAQQEYIISNVKEVLEAQL